VATATRPWAKEAPGERQQQQVAIENIVRCLLRIVCTVSIHMFVVVPSFVAARRDVHRAATHDGHAGDRW
jgi:hypothetical protein